MCQDETHYAEAPSTVGASYVAPSPTELLAPDVKVGEYFKLNLTKPYFVQRLTHRTYWWGGGFYTCTFHVGDKGVLVFDPPDRQGENVLSAIREVTSLPVTGVVYSHYHADHLLGIEALLSASSEAGATVRIIASEETAEKMRLLKSGLPAPTEVVKWPKGDFDFEGMTVRLDGFTRASHTDDAGIWLLASEQVAHLPDLVNPDEPPFRRFAVSENYVYYRPNVVQLGALDWTHLVGGHGNIGSKADIRFYTRFLDDLDDAVATAMTKAQFADGASLAEHDNHAVLMVEWMSQVTGLATDALRPKYGKLYGFEISTPDNAEMIVESMISYR